MSDFEHDKSAVWHANEIHCLDFEGSRRSGVVEYGLVTIRDLGIVQMNTRLCRGVGVISDIETATHQIQNSDVENADPLSDSWELFRDLRASGPFAAHHAGVENGLIKMVWPYTSRSKNFLTGESDVDWGPWLDTCALYRSLFPDLESYNLAALIQVFELGQQLDALAAQHCPSDRSTFHCAAFDALASAVLILQLQNYEELKSLTLPQLLQWSQPGKANPSEGNQLELL